MVKKLFGRFCWSDFKINDQSCFRLTSTVDENALLVIMENKPKISMEEIAKSLKIDISTDFCHLKRLGFMEKQPIFHHDSTKLHVAKQTLWKLKELK